MDTQDSFFKDQDPLTLQQTNIQDNSAIEIEEIQKNITSNQNEENYEEIKSNSFNLLRFI